MPRDSAIANVWFQRAAETGTRGDQRTIYTKDYDAPEKYTGAVQRFLEAAEKGESKAHCTLGMMYASGFGVPKDTGEAVKWLRKAAAQGDSEAVKWLR